MARRSSKKAVFKHIRDIIAKEGSNAWFSQDRAKDFARRLQECPFAATEIPQRDRHHGCLVRFGQLVEWRPQGAGLKISRPISTLKATTNTGAGSTLLNFERRLFRASRLSKTASPMAGSWTRTGRRCRNRPETASIRPRSPTNSAPICSVYGPRRSITRPTSGSPRVGNDSDLGDQYRKIRNTFKFMLGNLQDGDDGQRESTDGEGWGFRKHQRL
jgi:hypothetical protein